MNGVYLGLYGTDLRRFDSDLASCFDRTPKPKDTTINELVTPTLTLEELVAWVDSQLNDDELRADDLRAPLREWADLKEAA